MGAILLLHEHGLLPVGQFLEANLFSGQLHGLRDHRDHVRQRVGLRLARSAHEDPSPSNKQQFTFLKVKSIGKKVWQDGRFTYHEVAVSRKAATTNNQDRAVYDACCTLNGSDTPSSASKRDPVLSNGMNFSDFDDTEPIPRTITARSSYREHFATNDAAGVGRCALRLVERDPSSGYAVRKDGSWT